jgi:hypothetical protein
MRLYPLHSHCIGKLLFSSYPKAIMKNIFVLFVYSGHFISTKVRNYYIMMDLSHFSTLRMYQ